jgi:hypothetical protein
MPQKGGENAGRALATASRRIRHVTIIRLHFYWMVARSSDTLYTEITNCKTAITLPIAT